MTDHDLTLETPDGIVVVSITALETDASPAADRLAALLEAAAEAPQDRSDAVTVTYTPCGHGQMSRRVTFEPFSDGGIDAEWLRVAETQGAEGWREVGSEPVGSLRIERGGVGVVE